MTRSIVDVAVVSVVFVAAVAGSAAADPPASPVNFRAVGAVKRVELAWDAPTHTGGSEVTLYLVYRSASPGIQPNGSAQLRVDPPGTAARDLAVATGSTYFYAVTAMNGDGESPPSGEVEVRVPLAPPRVEGLHASMEGATVRLRWLLPVGTPIGGFEVWRDAGPAFRLHLTTGFEGATLDEDVEDGDELRYAVTAFDPDGTGRSRDWDEAQWEHELTDADVLPFDVVLDRDADGTRDRDDAYPLDATRSERGEDLVGRWLGWAAAILFLVLALAYAVRPRGR